MNKANTLQLTTQKPEQVIAINLHDVSYIFLDQMKCNSGKHEFQIIQKENDILTSQCGCTADTKFTAASNIPYKNLDNTIMFASKGTWIKFFDTSKQKCGFIPKIKIIDNTFQLSCGHHIGCPAITIQTLGCLTLI